MNGQNSINDRGSMAIISTKEEIVDIYLKYQKSLFHLAMTYVDTLYLAEDLVEDTIVAILEKSPVFESEASCVCYLRQIVRNKAKSMLRKKYKIEPQEDTDIEEQLIKSNDFNLPYGEVEVQLLLLEILSEYPQNIREAFIAHIIDQETIPVLAAYYGIKADTLKKQIGRMKSRIAESIPQKDMRAFLFILMLLS